uniref:AAA+ ATPase domain-containing protein n=1 Tax=Kalanchoe fedtschenkoi TaxID=63787 RepID=A0A7N0VLK2_KALFE
MDDVDIPMPDELEWLEANSHLPEDELECFGPMEPFPDDEIEPSPSLEQQKQTPKRLDGASKSNATIDKAFQSADPCPPSENVINGQKRLRSGDQEISNEKRSRTVDVELEDWLRYSPPRENEEANAVEEVTEKFVSRFASEIDGDFIPVTGLDGDRVYVKICRVDEVGGFQKLDLKACCGGLTLEPITSLMQKVEQETFLKTLQASSLSQNEEVIPVPAVATEQLWVEKYAPSSFTDLLSDEKTNREVLLWLKQWDSCVFGSEIRSTNEEVFSALRRHSSIRHHHRISDRSFLRKNGRPGFGRENLSPQFRNQENNIPAEVQHQMNKKSKPTGPPEQKILLLCGSPGLGKTTLAHVAANHCGYRVVEINASDDRSASNVESKILDVIQMNSVMTDSKPKCLVIDEIDGSLGDGKGAVEVVLKMIAADKRSDTRKVKDQEGTTGKHSSKRSHESARLLRPVICICNDQYAPALRQLRQVAKVHVFVQPTVNRVVSRLKQICIKEGMTANSIALTTLAEYTGCDIRSCLNTLQFLHKKRENLNMLDINSQVGRKDMSKSVFDIWREVFQKRKEKRGGKHDGSHGRMLNGVDTMHSLLASRGDYELIMDGIHENMLHLRYHDPGMQKTVKCLNGLGVSDLVHQYIMHTQQMSLYVYQPQTAIRIHREVAQIEKPMIEWPKSFHRHRTALTEKLEVLRSWNNKIGPYISRHLSIKSFTEDSVSLLLHILSPPTLRPVVEHLLSEKEKKDLARLVGLMCSYSITYKHIKSDHTPSTFGHDVKSDALVLTFDPPIAEFVCFKDYKPEQYMLASAVKQVLVHEVEKQKILLITSSKSINKVNETSKDCHTSLMGETSELLTHESHNSIVMSAGRVDCKKHDPNETSLLASAKTLTSTTKHHSTGTATKPPRSSTSFFDRFVKLNSKGSQISDTVKPNLATAERDSRPVLFKFNEGFTNAVKRPVRIREFFL